MDPLTFDDDLGWVAPSSLTGQEYCGQTRHAAREKRAEAERVWAEHRAKEGADPIPPEYFRGVLVLDGPSEEQLMALIAEWIAEWDERMAGRHARYSFRGVIVLPGPSPSPSS